MVYFVRAREAHKEGGNAVYPERLCSDLTRAVDEAKRMVLESERAKMLQADVGFKNGAKVRMKYRCWIDERGLLQERALV